MNKTRGYEKGFESSLFPVNDGTSNTASNQSDEKIRIVCVGTTTNTTTRADILSSSSTTIPCLH